MKGNVKRIVSGLLSAVTVLSAFLQPIGVYAAELEPAAYEAEYPALEKVKAKLDKDEIMAAEDHTVAIDSSFDVEHDLSDIKFSPDKVKITFHEAKDKDGEKFDIGKAGTYRAVYFVELMSKHPSYHISRNIIVKEKASASSSRKQAADGEGSENSYSDDSEGTAEDGEGDLPGKAADTEKSPKESMTEAEMEAVIEGMEQAEGVRQDAEMIAEEEGILLFAGNRQTAKASGSATMVKGRKIYYPGNLGNYSTCYFTVNGKIAYCLESAKGSPNTGSYAAQILEGNPNLQKTLYYGYGGTGDVTASYMPSFDEDLKYVFTHIAASYFYCGMDGFAGCTLDDLRDCGVLGWIDYLESLPAPPDPQISLSKTSLQATFDGSKQVTGTTKLNGDSRNSITITLPKDVTFHNKKDGSKQKGGNVRVSGGTSFYFSAPVTVNGAWSSGNMKGSIRTVWKALVVPTGSSSQDIGSYYEEESGSSVNFSVDWLERAKVKVIKVDSIANAKLSGAVFGIYCDKDCTDLITRMPATDSNGTSEAEIVMTQGTVYLKEITAPVGYRYNATAYRVTLQANKTASTTVPDVEQLGNLTVYKEGEVLIGADSNAEGVTFRYENRRQKGAVFNVYAARDITTPYGAVVYKAGELVAENLVTGDNGSVTLKNLHLGTYRVAEMQAPKNFYNKGETKDVAITYAGQMAEAAFSDTTFLNDRQKADVRVVKKDKDTLNGLAGGIFGLYASENITNADGDTVVSKGTLLDKVTTDSNGNAAFSTDLPIGFGYEVKEIQAPEGYLRNTEDVYSFRFSYTNDQEAKVAFSHIFANERVDATIRLQKKDKETNKNIPQGDAMLEHAVYGLYARNDILHPDKKTGVLYKAGEQVGTLTTDKEGKAEVADLYLGEYFVKEITPPTGYLADETEHDLVCSYEGDLVATVERDCTSLEQVKKQPFQISKPAQQMEAAEDMERRRK